MRIAHIDTEQGWRGGQQQVLSLIQALHVRGFEGIAIVRSGGELELRLRGIVKTFGVRPLTAWSPLLAARVRRRLLAEQIEVVHAHTGHAVAIAALATIGTTIPSVATRRVDFPIRQNALSRWKYARQSRVIAISSGVSKVLIASGIPANRIDLVPSGVDFRRFSDLPKLVRKDIGVSSQSLVVGQIAALAPHKDQPNFLRAVQILRTRYTNIRAVIVGDGAMRSALVSLAAELGINDIVSFLGYRADALSCLKLFDIFCLSSWGEGLGTSIIDAMALGIPVVATKVGGIPDLIEDGRTGFLAEPRDPAALAQAIDRALAALNREEMVAHARAKAKQFSIDRTADSMGRIYREVVGSRAS